MDPRTNQPTGRRPANNRAAAPKSKISNLSIAGLATGLSAAFIVHGQLIAVNLLTNFHDAVTIGLFNLTPVIATILSILGLKAKGQSDLSRKIALVGLIVGLAMLLVSGLYSYVTLTDNSIFGLYENIFGGDLF